MVRHPGAGGPEPCQVRGDLALGQDGAVPALDLRKVDLPAVPPGLLDDAPLQPGTVATPGPFRFGVQRRTAQDHQLAGVPGGERGDALGGHPTGAARHDEHVRRVGGSALSPPDHRGGGRCRAERESRTPPAVAPHLVESGVRVVQLAVHDGPHRRVVKSPRDVDRPAEQAGGFDRQRLGESGESAQHAGRQRAAAEPGATVQVRDDDETGAQIPRGRPQVLLRQLREEDHMGQPFDGVRDGGRLSARHLYAQVQPARLADHVLDGFGERRFVPRFEPGDRHSPDRRWDPRQHDEMRPQPHAQEFVDDAAGDRGTVIDQ